MLIHQDGLPNSIKELSLLYFGYHEYTGVPKAETIKGSTYYRRHIDNKHREHLQKKRKKLYDRNTVMINKHCKLKKKFKKKEDEIESFTKINKSIDVVMIG